MQLTSFLTVVFATLAVASPAADIFSKRDECVGNLNQCNKKASAPVGRQCCDGLYCCGIIGANNVCQSVNDCGE